MDHTQQRATPPSDGTLSAEEDTVLSIPRRPVVRHARSVTRILMDWLSSHSAWPYPTIQEKAALSERTGLTSRQIACWFVNTRRRSSEKLPKGASATNDTPVASPSLPAISRYPRDGSIPAVAGHDDWIFGNFDAANTLSFSASSWDVSTSSHSSDSSIHHSDSGSRSTFLANNKRRRRKQDAISKTRRVPVDGPAQGGSDRRVYQCTFCTDTFKSRYDWTRHEGALHLTLEQWTCMPFGPRYHDAGQVYPRCSLCDKPDPSNAHVESHRVSGCSAKPLSARVFQRKDHLCQHLRLCHGVDKMLPSMSAWKVKVLRITSRCGFCGETFSLWSDRNDHLADHFRRGAVMEDWEGDRGLEPAISGLVENAMPPCLI
ncbi:hypothetical protein CONLIGDRAFT_586329, partial [Coniochaeta ligniaria NRRL 30616]